MVKLNREFTFVMVFIIIEMVITNKCLSLLLYQMNTDSDALYRQISQLFYFC